MAASKKWKYTVRVQHDGRPIGTWLEMHGYAPKAALCASPLLPTLSCAVEGWRSSALFSQAMHMPAL